jgi:hypothetical protein
VFLGYGLKFKQPEASGEISLKAIRSWHKNSSPSC